MKAANDTATDPHAVIVEAVLEEVIPHLRAVLDERLRAAVPGLRPKGPRRVRTAVPQEDRDAPPPDPLTMAAARALLERHGR